MNPKRERFISEYLKDQNASQAAIRAGYSKKNANVVGPRVLVKVRKEVDARIAKIAEKVDVDKAYWLSSVREVLERCKQATPVMEYDSEEKCLKPTGEWKFDSTGANAALRMIGQYLGLLSDRQIHEFKEPVKFIFESAGCGNERSPDQSNQGL